jgi:hypothetical protein
LKIKCGNVISEASLWKTMMQSKAAIFQLSKEALVELCHQIWTTFSNISSWFDAWGKIALVYGFATEQDGSVQFSWEQRRCIINLDETNFSLNGSDGSQGGHTSQNITVAGVNRLGTAINKSIVSST